MPYNVFTTVNKPNGTDYDMATRDFATFAELCTGIQDIIADAQIECAMTTTFPPSSIIITVVPH